MNTGSVRLSTRLRLSGAGKAGATGPGGVAEGLAPWAKATKKWGAECRPTEKRPPYGGGTSRPMAELTDGRSRARRRVWPEPPGREAQGRVRRRGRPQRAADRDRATGAKRAGTGRDSGPRRI